MGINLKGFATGFAKTLATRIEDEREKEEKILSNRFNLAASNRLTRQKEASELRKVYETRVKNFSSVYPMATEQQIAAAISTETNYDTLMKAHEEGFSDDEKANILSNYVKVGEMPEKFTTAMDLVQQRVQPQVGEVKPAEGQTNKLLGFIDVSPGERKRQMYAEQYGVGADELDAYSEGAGTVSDLGSMGSVSSGFLKKPVDIEAQIKNIDIAATQPDVTPEELQELNARKMTLLAQKAFGQEPATLEKQVDRLTSRMRNATGQEREKLKAQIDEVNALIKSNKKAQALERESANKTNRPVLTFPQTLSVVRGAVTTALENDLNISQENKNKITVEYFDQEENRTVSRVRKIKPSDGPAIISSVRRAALQSLRNNGHMDDSGKILDDSYAIPVLTSLGLLDENGNIIPDPMADIKNAEDAAAAQAQGEAPPPAPLQKESVTVDGKVYDRPENFTDDQWKKYKESLGIS